MNALARGGPPGPRDLLELAKFKRFLTDPLRALLPEWRPYMNGAGDPPPPPTPAHGGYPGAVIPRHERRDICDAFRNDDAMRAFGVDR